MDPCTAAPVGLLPYGYHAVDFGERMANAGPEAWVTFIGPSVYRISFLGEIFGIWMAANDPATNACCACLASPPCPYPYIAGIVAGEEDYTCPGIGQYECLWPDTFQISRESPTCQPLRIACDDEELPICRWPMFYGSQDDNGNQCECYCEITVNYRHKNHASWPRLYQPCHKCPPAKCIWQPPDIPQGTFIEVRQEAFVSARIIKGVGLKYTKDPRFPLFDDLFPIEEEEENPCQRRWLSTGPQNNFDWCNQSGSETVRPSSDLGPSQNIMTTKIEVIWSNVPIYWKQIFDLLVGSVNDTVFLGYPPEGVMFMGADPVIRGAWGCNEVYDITMQFLAQTVPINCPSVEDDPLAPFTDEELASVGIFGGQIGLWNRMWHENPIYIEHDSKKICCTNWIPVELDRSSCCAESEEGTYPSHDVLIYPRHCLNQLFSFYECPSCYNDCPESWPDCAFS